jgi:uncharacterized protein involved in outer membrane biogenesis
MNALSMIRNKPLPKWVKVLLYVLLVFVILTIITWAIAMWYIKSHKQELLTKIKTSVSEQINGNFEIKDMEPSLWSGFPIVSVRLMDISLSDSLYTQHHINLVEIKSVYVQLNVFSLLSGNTNLRKVTIEDGDIHLFVDTSGYTNSYVFKGKEKKEKESKNDKAINIDLLRVKNVTFTFDHWQRNKQFKVRADDMNCSIETENDIWYVDADTKAFFYQLGFNLDNGGFVKNKNLEADLHFQFNPKTKQLLLPRQSIVVNDDDINFGCTFEFGLPAPTYDIYIDAPEIKYKDGVSFLSNHIAQKLEVFDLKKDIGVIVSVKGSFQYPDTPLIKANWVVKNNNMTTPAGALDNASFTGMFYNNHIPDRGKGDDNSAVTVNNFTASFQEIPFVCDTVLVYGLINPKLDVWLKASFPVSRLNNILDNTFSMKSGSAAVDIHYTGPVVSTDTFARSLKGNFKISNTSFTYVPRHLNFNNCNINLTFLGSDVLLNPSTVTLKSSTLKLDGAAHNFLNIYFSDPTKMDLMLNVNSNLIDLNELKSLVVAPNAEAKKVEKVEKLVSTNQKINRISNNISNMFEKGSVSLHARVGKVQLLPFVAQNVVTDIVFSQNAININNVSLNHANGNIAANALVNISGNNTPFVFKAKVQKVDIDQVFTAFQNFGQKTLLDKNLKGKFNADIDVAGRIKSTGQFDPSSFSGTVKFKLENGELNAFPPFETIKKFVFKKRNLSHVTFDNLENELKFSAGKITIAPMEIVSSAVLLRVGGIYAFDKGTDLSVSVPLRNPAKDKELIAQGKTPKKDKGIIIHLRAMDDASTGKVKISWDPMKRGQADTVKDDDESD